MTAPATITSNSVVDIIYTLYGPDGRVIDRADAEDPFTYLHGHSNIVPGLERRLQGLAVGARLDVTVPAAEAYGERLDGGPRRVPKDAFPPDAELEEGEQYFMMGDDDGEMTPFWVLDVATDSVVIDFNHPLAGLELRFEVEVRGIREATAEEVAHGHVHGPEGHHHHEHAHEHEHGHEHCCRHGHEHDHAGGHEHAHEHQCQHGDGHGHGHGCQHKHDHAGGHEHAHEHQCQHGDGHGHGCQHKHDHGHDH